MYRLFLQSYFLFQTYFLAKLISRVTKQFPLDNRPRTIAARKLTPGQMPSGQFSPRTITPGQFPPKKTGLADKFHVG